MGATMVVMISRGMAARQSTIWARARAMAVEMAVTPLSHSDQGIITCFSSKLNRPRTGVAIKATPRPIIPARKDRTNKTAEINAYNIAKSLPKRQ
jgi:hypothetical protein